MGVNQNRIRGKETPFNIYFDGVRLFGSFVILTEYTITFDSEITKQMFIGQKRAFSDVNQRGIDWSITTQLANHRWAEVQDRLDRQEKAGRPNFDTRVVLQANYREVSFRQVSLEGQGVMRTTEISASEDGYVTVGFEGFAQQFRTV